MKKVLRMAALMAMTAGFFPAPLYADSVSKTFRVSVTIPEQIQLDVPSRLRGFEIQPASLMMRTNGFKVGPQTNVGPKIDTCIVNRELGGRPLRVFTMTVL